MIAKDASAEFTLTGESVQWFSFRGKDHGITAIFLDGVYKRTIDLYNPEATQQVAPNLMGGGSKKLGFADLPPGKHQFSVVGGLFHEDTFDNRQCYRNLLHYNALCWGADDSDLVFAGGGTAGVRLADSASTTPTASAAIPGNKKTAAGVLNVGSDKQLFLDGSFFASSKNVTLRMNPPVKMGPVLLPDKPWESADMGFCVSVVDDGGRCKMWYLTEGKDSKGAYHLCYAESKDGVVWEKPNLGLIASNGSIDNNIVMAGTVETTVFLDPVAAPESRYKAIAMMCWPDPKKAGLYVHTSPDGIHWKMSDERVFPVAADTANQAFVRCAAEKICGQHSGVGADAQDRTRGNGRHHRALAGQATREALLHLGQRQDPRGQP